MQPETSCFYFSLYLDYLLLSVMKTTTTTTTTTTTITITLRVNSLTSFIVKLIYCYLDIHWLLSIFIGICKFTCKRTQTINNATNCCCHRYCSFTNAATTIHILLWYVKISSSLQEGILNNGSLQTLLSLTSEHKDRFSLLVLHECVFRGHDKFSQPRFDHVEFRIPICS